MDPFDNILQRLAVAEECGYHANSVRAMEPTALAALALLAHGRADRARPHLDWLAEVQGIDGSIGVEAGQGNPGWPTGWAIVAWQLAANTISPRSRYAAPLERAAGWLLSVEGSSIEYLDKTGHDTTIIGWPWVQGTHSWIEPTAISVLALKHAGLVDHPRTREGVRLLVDRLLRSGGCNYGNTIIFGQQLRPHLQPTGLTLLALAGERGVAANRPRDRLSAGRALGANADRVAGVRRAGAGRPGRVARRHARLDRRGCQPHARPRRVVLQAGAGGLGRAGRRFAVDPARPPARSPDAMSAPTNETAAPAASSHAEQLDRRSLLIGAGAALAALAAWPLVRRAMQMTAGVFVARNQRYDGPIEQTIRDGLLATGFNPAGLTGKRVLLKPNLVEPTRSCPQMTTHPAVVLAAAEVFRRWGAHVTIGEGPGHLRDTEVALVESGMQDALDRAGLPFADLNYSEVAWVKNGGRRSSLAGFYFPREVVEADLIVSMPKMKTHHWVGYTGALKNLYGTIPGIKYGWPKNVLHYAGIPETVFDINASLAPTVAVVDGIVAMEGDGPIMGSAKPMGLILVGTNSTAVDATLGRIMGFDPARVGYLQLAANHLGPVDERAIQQRGETWQSVESPFKSLDYPHLKELRTHRRAGDLIPPPRLFPPAPRQPAPASKNDAPSLPPTTSVARAGRARPGRHHPTGGRGGVRGAGPAVFSRPRIRGRRPGRVPPAAAQLLCRATRQRRAV